MHVIPNEELIKYNSDITVCDLVGLGFQDAVIGNCIYKKFKQSLHK